jgi:hypothetical protein
MRGKILRNRINYLNIKKKPTELQIKVADTSYPSFFAG